MRHNMKQHLPKNPDYQYVPLFTLLSWNSTFLDHTYIHVKCEAARERMMHEGGAWAVLKYLFFIKGFVLHRDLLGKKMSKHTQRHHGKMGLCICATDGHFRAGAACMDVEASQSPSTYLLRLLGTHFCFLGSYIHEILCYKGVRGCRLVSDAQIQT